jgi:DNA-binding beta-propeller fold protein YncE
MHEPTSVAISPDGKNVYSTATGSEYPQTLGAEGVEVLSRDPNTGAVAQLPGTAGCVSSDGFDDNGTADACGKAAGLGDQDGDGPNWVTVSPDGKNVYVTNGSLGTIVVFARDSSNGALSAIQCLGETFGPATGCSASSPNLYDLHALVVSADGAHAYAVSGGSSPGAVLVFDRAADGTLTPAAGVAHCVTLSGLDNNDDSCGQARALIEPYHLALSPDGKQLYVASSEGGGGKAVDGAVVTLNVQSDGSLVQPDGPAGCLAATGSGDASDPTACAQGKPAHDLNGVAVSPDGKNVYAASAGNGGPSTPGAVEILTRNPATGALSQDVETTAGCLSLDGTDGYQNIPDTCAVARGIGETYRVAVSPDGATVYVASQGIEQYSAAAPAAQGVQVGWYVPGNIAAFSRGANGALTQLSGTDGCISDAAGNDGQGGTTCAPGRALEGSFDIAITSDCTNAYVAAQNAPSVASFSRHPCLPPVPVTNPATDVTTASATLNGTVNPRGTAATAYFEWGTSTAYGSTTPTQNSGDGTSASALSAGISGLSAGTTYHFRVVASNQYGNAVGADQQFTTPVPPPVVIPAAVDKVGPKILVLGAHTFGGACSRSSRLRIRMSVTDPSGIRRVDVFVDGKRIRQATVGKFSVTISAKSLRTGRHRIRVIAFDQSGNKASRTVLIRRCAAKKPTQLVAPTFTG